MLFDERVDVDYDYVWFVEYDVRCPGNWRTTLELATWRNPTADFVARNPQNDPGGIDAGFELRKHGITEVRQTLFAVTRFSRRLLRFFRHRYYGRVSAYCEVLLPSIAHAHNFTMIDLEWSVIRTHFYYRPQCCMYHYRMMVSYLTLWDENRSVLIHPVVQTRNDNSYYHMSVFDILNWEDLGRWVGRQMMVLFSFDYMYKERLALYLAHNIQSYRSTPLFQPHPTLSF